MHYGGAGNAFRDGAVAPFERFGFLLDFAALLFGLWPFAFQLC
jgi:hypothetical protein